MSSKPPFGLEPAFLWRERYARSAAHPAPRRRALSSRITNIEAALWRYHEARVPPPGEWLDELAQLRDRVRR
jgi:hypothetical protein